MRKNEQAIVKVARSKNHRKNVLFFFQKCTFLFSDYTGISTIVMVLKQQRNDSDILFIDASQGYEKNGKNNRLRDCDIRRVTDAVAARTDIPHFAAKVPIEEIRNNDYNLNISRYISSEQPADQYDLYATMFGGIPCYELDRFAPFWQTMPNLKNDLFAHDNEQYVRPKVCDIRSAVLNHGDTAAFRQHYAAAFSNYNRFLFDTLVVQNQQLHIQTTEEQLTNDLFLRLKDIPLIDPYQAYQIFRNQWNTIASDIEILKSEGLDSAKQIDPNMVVKKQDDNIEVQDGYIGHIFPLSLVQQTLLNDKYSRIQNNRQRLNDIDEELTALIDDFTPEEQEQSFLNDDNTAFCKKPLSEQLKRIYSNITSPEICALQQYLNCSTKKDKLAYIANTPLVRWSNIEQAANGTYTNKAVQQYLTTLRSQCVFPEDSFEYRIKRASDLLAEQDTLKKTLKQQEREIMVHTQTVMQQLTQQQIYTLLAEKWITPLCQALNSIPDTVINDFSTQLQLLAHKYEETLIDIQQHIRQTQDALNAMLDQLTGSQYDINAIKQLQQLIK